MGELMPRSFLRSCRWDFPRIGRKTSFRLDVKIPVISLNHPLEFHFVDMKLPIIARRIREARLSLHLSRESLSEQVGVSAKSIQRYEEAKQMPRVKILERIGGVLEISLDAFFREPTDGPVPAAKISLEELAAGQQILLARIESLTLSVEQLTRLVAESLQSSCG